jgi:hypothetical protein
VGGGGGGGGGDGGASEAYVECVELEGLNEQGRGRGWGDRSRTWRWRTTRPVDQFSTRWPDRFAQISPVISRVSIDGDYLRAMLGGAYVVLFPMAIGLGILAAESADWVALPPALGFFVAILALSVLDSMLGYTAAVSFAASILIAGNLDNEAAFREICGLTLIWFAMPLCAAAIRPLRRRWNLAPDDIWDRSADVIMGGLFAAWVAANQVSSLGPLSGYELPIADYRWTIALIVIGLVAFRVVLESVCAYFYPGRLLAVQPQGECEAPRLQEAISTFIQFAVLIWVSSSFMGWDNWALWVGGVFFFIPLIPWLFIEKVPYSPFIAKWMPAGLVKWTWVIGGIVLMTMLLDALVKDPQESLNWGFILVPLPILICWALELFAENEPEEDEDEEAEELGEPENEAGEEDEEDEEDDARFPLTWPVRVAGVPLLALSVYLVYFVIG